ncbi:MAG TPA: ABC transporter ATP-binding protein [Candidatus Cloacimonadota bacterium]|nr:ABC transporter ATP-binding protein [Candidatus Cloacimonadota bacterium]
MAVKSGEICAITGPNSCGKTSLLYAISGIIPQYIHAQLQGNITLTGLDLMVVPLNERFHYLGLLMANPKAQLLFPDGTSEIAFALENLGLPPDDIRSRIANAAGYFGIENLLDRSPLTLSGGEQKLLLLAALDALSPPLMLLDEPEAALSGRALHRMLEWLVKLKQNGHIVLVATHSDTLLQSCDQVLYLGMDNV